MEKARAFHLAGFADADTAEVSLARALVKFGAAEAAIKLHAVFRCANPNGQSVGLIVK